MVLPPDEEISSDESEAVELTREERRNEAEAFSALAEMLVKDASLALPDPPFDAGLRKAVEDARPMVKSARPRQIRYVARLLREAGHLDQFRAAVEGRSPAMLAEQAREQLNEAWRTRLVEEGDAALTEFLTEFPRADRSRLRQLARQARRTPPDARSKKAATKLIREIRAATRE